MCLGTHYIQGRIAYNPDNHSIFMDSNHRADAVAEFAIPETLSLSSNVADLPVAQPLQGYRKIFTATDTGNPEGTDKIGGMYLINGELFIQVYETYDASGKNPYTTAIVRDPNNLSSSNIDGFFEMEGAARTSMYISPVPAEWQSSLGGAWIAGMGAGMSINSRFSEGPSLYVFDPEDFKNRNRGRISTIKHLDYPFDKALSTKLYRGAGAGGWDSYNASGKNLLWTQISNARYAFIIPNTRTYAVIGNSGALRESGGYKITNKRGYVCPGPCPYSNEDFHTYYWLYDLNEILAARRSYDPVPYEYGILDDRFVSYDKQGLIGGIRGGSFDPGSGRLFLIRASTQARSGSPVISVYQVAPPSNDDTATTCSKDE